MNMMRVMRERGLLARPRRLRAQHKKRVGPRGSRRAESDLAIGHDENLGGARSRLGVPGGCDQLLDAEDCRLACLAPLPDRRCAGSRGTGGSRTTARGQSRGNPGADYPELVACPRATIPRSGHFLCHVQEQLAICFLSFSQQATKLVKKAPVLAGTSPSDVFRRLPPGEIGQFGRLFTILEKLVKLPAHEPAFLAFRSPERCGRFQ